jgi:hypothetical protein
MVRHFDDASGRHAEPGIVRGSRALQFRDQYERALAFRTHLQLDEIAEIADNCRPGMVRKAKLQIDARKWIVSRMMPKLARGQG